MSETPTPAAPPAEANGALPAPPSSPGSGELPAGQVPNLPEGTVQLPPAMVARLTRLMQENPVIHDMLFSFIEGRELTGRTLALVVPVILLVPPKE